LPRTSQAAALAIPRISRVDRLAPPAELGEAEARVFRQTVAAAPPDYFRSEDLVLLCAYVRAAVLERLAAEQLAAAMAAGSASKPLLAVYAQVSKTLMNLTVRLLIGPRSRAPSNNRRRAGKADGALSYYDVMDLGDADEEGGSGGAAARDSNGEGRSGAAAVDRGEDEG
jgi:hypothetical protein